MGILNTIFGKHRAVNAATATAELPTAPTDPPCPHTTLMPRWDNVADMGKDNKVTSYTCDSCQESFTAGAGHALQATETARVHRALDT
jgi:hypothetical protein